MPLYNVTVDDSSPVLQFSEGWEAGPNQDPGFLNGTDHATKVKDANVTLIFNGTAIWLGGPLGPSHGDYSVTLDGESVQDPGFATEETFQQVLFSKTNLENTEHKIVLSNLPQNSSRQFVGLDFVTFTTGNDNASTEVSELIIDDTDPSLVYSGWSTTVNQFLPLYHNSTFHLTNIFGATLEIPFNGSAIAVYGAIAPNHGPFSVYLDGVGPVSANGSAPSFQAQTLLFYASNLANSSHVVSLVNTNANTSAFLDFDFAVISQYVSSLDPNAGPSTNLPSKQKHHVGAITGGIIGGVAVLALIAAFLFHRRMRLAALSSVTDTRQQQLPSMSSLPPSAMPPVSQLDSGNHSLRSWKNTPSSLGSGPTISSGKARPAPLAWGSNQYMAPSSTFSSISSQANERTISSVSASTSEPLSRMRFSPRNSSKRKDDNVSSSSAPPQPLPGHRDAGPALNVAEDDDLPPPNYADVFHQGRSPSGMA